MDQLIGKLTNLSYELFGIFVPGFVLFLFLVWWWWCAGEIAPLVSFGYLSSVEMKGVAASYGLVPSEIKGGLVVYILVASYFLGHLINWVGRSGGAKESDAEKKFLRAMQDLGRCLLLSVPKSRASYYSELEPLLKESMRFLQLPKESSEWRVFYPVAKSRVAQELTQSLIVTYQNKYTLHRSLAIASSIFFWVTYFTFWFSLGTKVSGTDEPHWFPMVLSMLLSLLAIWGFSESYRFHWKMFGNAVIAETFMLARQKK